MFRLGFFGTHGMGLGELLRHIVFDWNVFSFEAKTKTKSERFVAGLTKEMEAGGGDDDEEDYDDANAELEEAKEELDKAKKETWKVVELLHVDGYNIKETNEGLLLITQCVCLVCCSLDVCPFLNLKQI